MAATYNPATDRPDGGGYDANGNGAEAVSLAGRAVQLTGGREPALLGTLAAASAEAGRFQDAVSTVQRALALAASTNQQSLATALKGNLALYEAKSPLRLPAPRPAGR